MAVELEPRLLEILACPCPEHAALRVDEHADSLSCTSCGRRFPVRDGIPVLLLEEATPADAGGKSGEG